MQGGASAPWWINTSLVLRLWQWLRRTAYRGPGSSSALRSVCTWAPCGPSSFLLFVFIVKERIPLGGVSDFSCPQSDREIPKLFCLSAFSQDDRYSERVGSLFAQVLRN